MPVLAYPKTDTRDEKDALWFVEKMERYFRQFNEAIEYIRDWKQYEVLELLIQEVDLGKVTIPWLNQFQEDLDLKV